MSEPAIRVEGVARHYGEAAALSGVSLSAAAGEMFGLIGPDGAGKTSLMRILATLIDPDEGEAWVRGFSVRTEPARIRRILGYMPQRFSLYPDLTVAENLRFFGDLFHVPKGERLRRTDELLDFSRLGPFVKRRAGQLSGGMKQKLALSCALIHTPEVLILDEPTTGVDPVSRHDFWRMLENLRLQGVSILVSTPYMNEASLCGRIAFIHKGEILAIGTAAEISALFKGRVIACTGPSLQAIAIRLKNFFRPEEVRILGDRVQVIAVGGREEAIGPAVEALKRERLIEGDAEEVSPDVEDSFVALMKE